MMGIEIHLSDDKIWLSGVLTTREDCDKAIVILKLLMQFLPSATTPTLTPPNSPALSEPKSETIHVDETVPLLAQSHRLRAPSFD